MEYLFVQVCEALCEFLVKLAASWFQHGHLFQGGVKLECTCDLFEQALEKCPQKFYECYQSCSGCWQIWGVLFVWEFITTDPSSRCSWFILQKATENFRLPMMHPIYECALCQCTSKTGSILDIQMPAELQQRGALKENGSLLNAWVKVLYGTN